MEHPPDQRGMPRRRLPDPERLGVIRPATLAFMVRAFRRLGHNKHAVYYKRYYLNGASRAACIATARRSPATWLAISQQRPTLPSPAKSNCNVIKRNLS